MSPLGGAWGLAQNTVVGEDGYLYVPDPVVLHVPEPLTIGLLGLGGLALLRRRRQA